MKILTVIGARPQFIKAAALSRIIRSVCTEVLVHTGQHYDHDMSEVFFEELSIPKPDYYLGVGSASHAKQTGDMLVGIEEVILKEEPDYLLVYGDTNSTLAGALAAAKLLIPVIHIEAGLRSYNKNMPEEQNRILTDHLSRLLFCPTQVAVDNLKCEGIEQQVFPVGDVMCDAIKYYLSRVDLQDAGYYWKRMRGLFHGEVPELSDWYLATVHRAENTDEIWKTKEILSALEELNHKVIFPVHPRIADRIASLNNQQSYKNILFIKPLGYMDMLFFSKNSEKIITDSGGLQKEAYMMNVPCVTLREQTEWVETLNGNRNILAKIKKEDIVAKVNSTDIANTEPTPYYGNGDAAIKITDIIMRECAK